MGLTIHYSLKCTQDAEQVKQAVHKMRQLALDLPFEEVGEIVEFQGEECNTEARRKELQNGDEKNESLFWLMIQAGLVMLPLSAVIRASSAALRSDDTAPTVPPVDGIGVTPLVIDPGRNPTTGPIAAKTLAQADQVPMARPRSSSGKDALSMERPWGISNAEPTPWIARAVISWPREYEAAHPAEAEANNPTPNRKVRRRP